MNNFGGDIWSDLKLDIKDFVTNMRRATSEAKRGASKMAGHFGRSTGGMDSAIKKSTEEVRNFGSVADKSFKDVSRVVQGILISQGFYKLIGAIQDTIKEIGKLSASFEQARVSFAMLLGNQGRADRFLQSLEDFAAKTPFTFDQARKSAQKLLAMGYKAEQVIPVLKDITDAAALSGASPEMIDRITLALGQVKTAGRLMQQDMMQLAEAGIPVFQILQEELGLTKDQLQELGKLNISADVGLEAIFRGMEKRYKGASEYISQTMTGLLNTIRDNFLLVAKDATEGLFKSAKRTVKKVADTLVWARDLVRSGGVGNLFESVFPPRAQAMIRLLVANIRILKESLRQLSVAMGPVIQMFATHFVQVLNLVLPIVSSVIRVFAQMYQWALNNVSAFRTFLNVAIRLYVFNSITKILIGFTKALKGMLAVRIVSQAFVKFIGVLRILAATLMAHPLLAAVTLGAAALLKFTSAGKKATKSAKNFGGVAGKAFAQGFGEDPDKVLQPKFKDTGKDLNEFNQKLYDSNKNLKDVGKGLDNAGKKGKKAAKKMRDALMSFDEVFVLPEDKADAGAAAAGKMADELEGLGDIDTGDIGDIGIPEMDDFNDGLDRGLSLFGSWKKAFKDWWDAIQRWRDNNDKAFTAWWDNTKKGFTDWYKRTKEGLVQWLKDTGKGIADWWTYTRDVFSKWWGYTSEGFVEWSKNTAKGLAEWTVDSAGKFATWAGQSLEQLGQWSWDTVQRFGQWSGETLQQLGEWSAESLRQFNGWIGDTLTIFGEWTVTSLLEFTTWSIDSLAKLGGWTVQTGQQFTEWATESLKIFGQWVGDSLSKFGKWVLDSAKGFGDWATDTGKKFGNWLIDTVQIFTDWDNLSWEVIQDWWSDTKEGFKNWAGDTWERLKDWMNQSLGGFGTWVGDSMEGFKNWWYESLEGFKGWARDSYEKLSTWWYESKGGFSEWCRTTKEGFDTWWENTKEGFTQWWTKTTEGLSTWWQNTKQGFNNWWIDTKSGFTDWWEKTKTGFNTWVSETKQRLITWWTETKEGFNTWWEKTKEDWGIWWTDTKKGISTWATDTAEAFSDWCTDTYEGFTGWWSDTYEGFTNWAKDTYEGVSEWWDKLTTKISEGWDNMKQAGKDLVGMGGSDDGSGGGSSRSLAGHARGGIFNKEHVARFAEGGHPEAAIPTANPSDTAAVVGAMWQNGLGSAIEKTVTDIVASVQPVQQGGNTQPVLYVKTLIADDQGLRELNRQMEIIKIEEDARRGL